MFASIVDPKRSSSERNALLLVESIRAFAGSLSGAPVWCFTPEHGGQVSDTLRDRLEALDVTLIPFKMDPEVAAFRFTGEASAAALAESMADGRVECLAWLNANSLVLREPREFLLPEGKSLGYRPVHHTNIGSRYGETLDPFWTLIYGYCDVPEGRVFPMRTHVDGEVIRPYFNAGCHATRPGRGLLRAWRDVYLTVYDEPDLKKFYGRDKSGKATKGLNEALWEVPARVAAAPVRTVGGLVGGLLHGPKLVSGPMAGKRLRPVKGPGKYSPADKKAYDAYQAKLTLLHGLIVNAMKAKQTTDVEHCANLRAGIDAFEALYMAK